MLNADNTNLDIITKFADVGKPLPANPPKSKGKWDLHLGVYDFFYSLILKMMTYPFFGN